MSPKAGSVSVQLDTVGADVAVPEGKERKRREREEHIN